MKTLYPYLFLAGALSAQDIAPKDAERDPVLSALLEDSEFIEVEDVQLDTSEDEPVLVTGQAPQDAEVVDPNAMENTHPEDSKGVRVEVEGGTTTSTFKAEQIRLVAPFPAKPLVSPPSGWELEHPKDAPPLSEKVLLANGSELVLSIRPHVLVPAADGSNIFALSEPGFDSAEGYAQTQTVGAVLADSIHQLDEQSRRLGAASRRLSELLDSLPHHVPTDSASTTPDP